MIIRLIHSIVIIVCAMAFLKVPSTQFCYSPGVNFDGVFWMLLVAPSLIIAVHMITESAATWLTVAQALFLFVAMALGCWRDRSNNSQARARLSP